MFNRLLIPYGIAVVGLMNCAWAEEIHLSDHLTVIRVHDHNIVQGQDVDGREFRLLSDFRRDGHLAGTPVPDTPRHVRYYIGIGETEYFIDPIGNYWNPLAEKGRFSEVAGTSLVPTASPKVAANGTAGVGSVAEGDIIDPQRNKIHVIDTPGITRDSVSYYVDIDGKRIVFCGNLIYGDGGLVNLYDLQDVMPVPKIGGYHGYMARGLKVIESLEKIKALKPDKLIPARGPIIENPQESIDKLIGRLRAVYENYVDVSALWWYFPDSMPLAARLFSGNENLEADAIRRMPQAKLYENPPWFLEFATTRVIVSENKAAFVIDSVGDGSVKFLDKLIEDGTIRTVEGIFITHYHWDHTAKVPAIAEKFQCPIYCDENMAPILEFRDNFHMPCRDAQEFKTQDFKTMKWHEFTLTSCFFPGQTLYHGALLIEKEGERPIFVIGDSFTPTGIDDYCLWNRNFPGDNEGYLYCLEKIRKMEPRPLLVNQHVVPPFEFDDERIDYMVAALKARREILATIFPYAAPEFGNGVGFGVDSVWARFEPYYVSAESDRTIRLIVRNHADKPLSFYVDWTEDGQQHSELLFRDVLPHGEQTQPFKLPEAGTVSPVTAVVRCREIPSLEKGVETMIGP